MLHEDVMPRVTAPGSISIVIPCLNEAKTLEAVIVRAREALSKYGYQGEVIVADNGSTDGSTQITVEGGARLVPVSTRGYGNALLGGILAARGDFIIIGDADDTYDFYEIDRFVECWRRGYDLVMGTRLKGKIEDGAMPPLHRYLGTPVLTFLINLFFGTRFSDCNSGIRGFTKTAFESMQIHSTGMEFASEMLIKSGLLRMKMAEVPVSLRVDRRGKPPHLKTWRDGWRHLRFILTYAADRILLVPGFLLTLVGVVGIVLLARGPLTIGNFTMDFHFLFPSALAVLLGTQFILFTFLTKAYTGLSRYSFRSKGKLTHFLTFETGIISGSVLFILGLLINVNIAISWLNSYGNGLFEVRSATIALTLMATGIQVFFTSFLIGVLKIPQRAIN